MFSGRVFLPQTTVAAVGSRFGRFSSSVWSAAFAFARLSFFMCLVFLLCVARTRERREFCFP